MKHNNQNFTREHFKQKCWKEDEERKKMKKKNEKKEKRKIVKELI